MRQLIWSFVWGDMSFGPMWWTSSRRDCFLRIHSNLLIYCMIDPEILINRHLRPPLSSTLLRFDHTRFICNLKPSHCEFWWIMILHRFRQLLFTLGYRVQRLLFLCLRGHFLSFYNQLRLSMFYRWVFIRRIHSNYIFRNILRVIVMLLDLTYRSLSLLNKVIECIGALKLMLLRLIHHSAFSFILFSFEHGI
jgi:hypothetical protein